MGEHEVKSAFFDELRRVCEKLAVSEGECATLREYRAVLAEQEQVSRNECNRLRAECAEMRNVLDNIWCRDELGKHDPEDQSGCYVCPECEAHLPHGGHSEDCITGQVSHALSCDCGKGMISVDELEPTKDTLRAIMECDDPFEAESMAEKELARLENLRVKK